MKNITTPRTMAECQFVTGYTSARPERAWPHLYGWISTLACLALAFFAGWLTQ